MILVLCRIDDYYSDIQTVHHTHIRASETIRVNGAFSPLGREYACVFAVVIITILSYRIAC